MNNTEKIVFYFSPTAANQWGYRVAETPWGDSFRFTLSTPESQKVEGSRDFYSWADQYVVGAYSPHEVEILK